MNIFIPCKWLFLCGPLSGIEKNGSYYLKYHIGERRLIISHIRVHETHTLFLIPSSGIYHKEKNKQVKVIIFYKFVMDSNTLLFRTTVPKMGHKLSHQGSSCVYISTSSILVSMSYNDQKHCITQLFLILQFRKQCRSGKFPCSIILSTDKRKIIYKDS